MNGLSEFLDNGLTIQANGQVLVGNDFKTPGYWAALAAHCRAKQIKFEKLCFYAEKTKGYASAIALENALNGTDGYPYERKNSGATYSELVLLDSAEGTDKANSAINSCIRRLFNSPDISGFVADLCNVIGDLHDNVWSHGQSTGFSMAQKWTDYYTQEDCFEFALADCGLGFLAELKRVGLPFQSDEESIRWCIEEGNSSKKRKNNDEWSQRLPSDIAGNPIPGIGQPVMSENAHMGLGLAKLIKLINDYSGQLWLASGEKTLVIEPNGNKSFKHNQQRWQGVALACRFEAGKVKNYKKHNDDETIKSLVELLF
ncbi:hypothetical protein KFZ76_06925 [Methylovulum psychrotolerans]|uniref:hypothetical protein n=1 Tax=Methylovulum psychrotolerans TaxID=1704499 RepID=UPI001BFFB032|nr:hypothetical protein [Methylovulum psychrotolerans]MBT9097443.1 hypothetical protein [Methylovulum psychrotolerans]